MKARNIDTNRNGLVSKVEEIGPDQAAQYLRAMEQNRPIRTAWVRTLTTMILNDQWRLTHQGIAIDRDGRLVDGQHRLQAIISSGKTVPMMVTRGVDPESYGVLDCGARRSYDERVRLDEQPERNKWITRVVTGYLRATSTANATTRNISAQRIAMVFEERPHAWRFGAEVYRAHTPMLRSQFVGAALAMYHQADPDKAQEFLAGYLSGEHLGPTSPILRLREMKMTYAGYGDKPDLYWKAVSACAAHRDGKKVERLYVAAIDMAGNENRRVIDAHRERGLKSWATKNDRGMLADVETKEPA